MIIGLDGSRAFLRYRTGIEEYSYQVITHLRNTLPKEAEVRVYVRKKISLKNGKFQWQLPEIDFPLPNNWQLVGLWAPRFWTQIRLSLEMLFHPVDALLIPAHTVPVIHPKNTTVVVHGLEYEVSKGSYSLWERFYMRSSIRYSVTAAQKVVSVSENTKKDLQTLYGVPAKKISVIHEGFVPALSPQATLDVSGNPYILFIGRLEARKNIVRILEAFEKLKESQAIPHDLVLVGKPGYGYEKIKAQLGISQYQENIFEKGYVSQQEKEMLLQGASLFLFPSLYEGFGLPILEAQAYNLPVVTSNTSSLPEVAGEGAVYVQPDNSEDIAEKIHQTLTLCAEEKAELIRKGRENLSRFSWPKCAEEMAAVLIL